MTGYSSARALEWPHNGTGGSISEVATASLNKDAGSCGKIIGSLKSLPWTRTLATWEPARSVRCDGVRKCIICRLICALISLAVPRAPQRGYYDSTTDGRLEGCPKRADWWSPNPPRTCSDLRCSWTDGISGLNSQRPNLAGLVWSFQIYVLPNLLQVTQLWLGGWALSAKPAGPQLAIWVGDAYWGKTWQEWNNSQRPKQLLSCCLRFSSTKDLFHMNWKRAWHEEHLTFPAWIILRITWEVLLILLLVLFWNGYYCFNTVSGPAP